MSEHSRYSLLQEGIFRVRGPDGARMDASLPDILARLSKSNILSFEALQPHQQQAWYSFLVQLATIATARGEHDDLTENPAEWRDRLLALTNGDPDPWSLVVDDLSKPAFMQSPVPEGSLKDAKYKADVESPDDLDMLATARNHDVKSVRIIHPRTEHWVYALLTLQTLQGGFGRGNYGIIRMNKSYGNRPLVGIVPALDWGERFRRDVSVLLPARQKLITKYGYQPTGHALLWLRPWDGSKSSGVPLADCDPLVIEICRRIRFAEPNGRLVCWRGTTKAARIKSPDGFNGATGDPWTPVEKANAKALTVGDRGFHYELIKDILLSGDYDRSASLAHTEHEEAGGYLLARTLSRGQGKTEGLHHRVVPLPSDVIRLFGEPSERELLAERADRRVTLASTVQKKVLAPALSALQNGGKKGEAVDWEKIRRWLNAFDASVDDIFFEHLWGSLDRPEEKADELWQRQLLQFAEEQLEDAIRSCPMPSVRRYRAVSSAHSIFQGSARKQLPLLFPDEKKGEEA